MHYINPFTLLGITAENFSDVDSSTINKAKRKLLAEIELSDTNSIMHSGVELTKGDCLKVIDDLDNNIIKEFHIYIIQNKPLYNFLNSRDLTFFTQYKVESIFKENEFLDFISPYFSEQYDKALIVNYKGNKINNLSSLLSVKPITNNEYYEKCYKSIRSFLRDTNSEIEKITKDIENKQSTFIDKKFTGLANIISEKTNLHILNLLPSYFQNLRNQLASSIRSLAVNINNTPYKLYEPAFKLIDIAYNISTDALTKQTITKGYFVIKSNYDDYLKTTEVKKQTQQAPPVVSVLQTTSWPLSKENIKGENSINKKGKVIIEWVSIASIFLLLWAFFNSVVMNILLLLGVISFVYKTMQYFNDSDYQKKTSYSQLIFNFILLGVSLSGIVIPLCSYLYVTYFLLIIPTEICYNNFIKKSLPITATYYALLISVLILFGFSELNTKTVSSKAIETKVVKALTDKQYFEKGRSFFNQSNFSDAIIQYNEAIKLNPNYDDAYLDRGVSKASLGLYDSAIVDYLKAEKLGFKWSVLYSNLGIAYFRVKQIDNAKTTLEKALNIDPTNADAYRYRGEIKYNENDNKGAVKDYSLAIKYKPDAYTYYERGLGYYYLEDYKKAINDIDKAINLNPNVGQYYFDRGDAKDKINDLNGACIDWLTAKTIGYNVPEYKINRCTPQIVDVSNGELTGCNVSNKYNKNLNNRLAITVGSNASVAVKLINYSTQKSIRYVFINKSTNYTIKNIPEGKYYLKIAYGVDWSKIQDQPNCSGKFTKNIMFEKGEDILDYNLIRTADGYDVPSFSLKLDVIVTEDKMSNFSTNKINENNFYDEQ